jgi:hypothetical protein
MSCKDDCWDSAPTERLCERLQVRRLHSTLGYIITRQYEVRKVAAQLNRAACLRGRGGARPVQLTQITRSTRPLFIRARRPFARCARRPPRSRPCATAALPTLPLWQTYPPLQYTRHARGAWRLAATALHLRHLGAVPHWADTAAPH